VVSILTNIEGSPRASNATAFEALNTIFPVAAPGLAPIPSAIWTLLAFGSICGCRISLRTFG